jgi:hypothetical protein
VFLAHTRDIVPPVVYLITETSVACLGTVGTQSDQLLGVDHEALKTKLGQPVQLAAITLAQMQFCAGNVAGTLCSNLAEDVYRVSLGGAVLDVDPDRIAGWVRLFGPPKKLSDSELASLG